MSIERSVPAGVDTAVPHSPRIWNYWLGGKDNYAVDRQAGDAWAAVNPDVVQVARESRAFLTRAVRHLAGEAGVSQFLDVGTGLPTADNTHEVAQRVNPEARIVYVDNDPMILAHARALLTSTPEGRTTYLQADMRTERAEIIDGAAAVLDLTRPVALMLMGVLGHVADLDEARTIVRELMAPLPSGSYLVINDGTTVVAGAAAAKAADEYADTGAVPYHMRTPEEIASFFDGLEWVEPGFVSVPLWRPAISGAVAPDGVISTPKPVDAFGGVARKP